MCQSRTTTHKNYMKKTTGDCGSCERNEEMEALCGKAGRLEDFMEIYFTRRFSAAGPRAIMWATQVASEHHLKRALWSLMITDVLFIEGFTYLDIVEMFGALNICDRETFKTTDYQESE